MSVRKLLVLATALFFTAVTVGPNLISPTKVSAANAANWQAGRIIDDNVFTNKDAMTVGEIQTFLNQKVGTGGYDSVPGQCDTNGVRNAAPYNSSISRAAYARSKNRLDKWTCLNNYYEVPKLNPGPGVPASNYGSASIPSGAKSAAQLIWDAAQQYSINPKVLLVTIQKESAGPLTTDDWPWQSQYTYAMGAHCPDNPPPEWPDGCDPNYAGFSIQIAESAALFRYYLDNMAKPWWTHYKLGNNSILYNPTTSCGSSVVNVLTKATAALYTYTPYQPNQAALNNLYGSAPPCGAYGNRNFWRIYTDWFGTTLGDPYTARFRNISPAATVYPGQNGTIWVDFENTGTNFWKDDVTALPYYPRTRLMGTWPINRNSIFYDSSSWLSPSRPVSVFAKVFENDGVTLASDQHTVFTGQVARFQFNVKYPANAKPGRYQENFELVQDGVSNWWVPGGYAWQAVTVPEPFSATFRNESAAANVSPGVDGTLWFDFQNTGANFWKDDTTAPPYYSRTRLVASWPINRVSSFAAPGWVSNSRPVGVFNKVFESDGVTLAADQHTVFPGQVGRFLFTVKHPGNIAPGTYKENFELVQDGATNWWVPGGYAWQAVNATN